MRQFYIRRKDFSQFPFQFYLDRDGVERRLEKGYTSTFAIEPPKDQYAFLHVHILEEFAREVEARWEIPTGDLIRIAAKGLEAWLKGEPIPDDHFNGIDLLKIDAAWYPRDPNQAPALAANPYRFEVKTDEPWPSILDWKPASVEPSPEILPSVEAASVRKKIVFGYTRDVFPGALIVGYHQFKRKVEDAGLHATISMLPLSDLPCDVTLLFVPSELAEVARQAAPHSRVEALDNFFNHPSYNAVIEELSGGAN